MPSIIAVHISLLPDWTVAVQLGVFLFVLTILNLFIFKPFLKVFDARRKFSSESLSLAVSINDSAAGVEKQEEYYASKRSNI